MSETGTSRLGATQSGATAAVPAGAVLPGLLWSGTLTAVSSIAHGGQTRGITTLLRREVMCQPDGSLAHVPVISGNALRGRLRRIGEELLRGQLRYDGELSAGAAHVLRGGGALVKTGREPLSGSRLARVRELVPQIAVFGGSGAGTIIGGALDVGKVIPHVLETNHITGAAGTRSTFAATQLEDYSRQDDTDAHDFTDHTDDGSSSDSRQMRFHVETFPAGTQFSCWLRLRWPTPLEVDFFHDVLAVFDVDGRLGGRIGIGHGQVSAQWAVTPEPPAPAGLWRPWVDKHRDEILTVLGEFA